MWIVKHRTDVKLRTQRLGQFICHTTKTNIHTVCNQISSRNTYIIIYVMRIRRTADQWWSLSCRPLQTDFVQFSDFRQTSNRLQMSDSHFRLCALARLQTSDFGFLTSDFEFHTSDLRLRTVFDLQTSEFELQTLNFRLRVRILDFGYTSDRPRPSDFELRSLNLDFGQYRLLQIFSDLKSSDFGLQTLKCRVQKPPLGFDTLNS